MNPATEEIEKIRSVRQRISASCGNDPLRLVLHYVARGKQNEKPYRKALSSRQTTRVNEKP
jgi:hypothetical protein